MKQLVIAILAGIVGFSAQANDRLDDQLLRLSDRMNQLISAKINELSTREKEEVIDHLQAIRRILRVGNNGGGHNGRTAVIQGKMEDTEFTFEVNDLEELFGACKTHYDSKVRGNVDDISVVVNYGQTHKLKNSTSYWKSGSEACMQIINVAQREGLSASRHGSRIILLGSIEETNEFYFSGDSLRDVDLQCQDYIQRKRIIKADDIKISSSFGPMKTLRNSASYWKGAVEICTEIIRNR